MTIPAVGVVTFAGGLAFLVNTTAELDEVTSKTPCGEVVLIPTCADTKEEHTILINKLDFFMVCFLNVISKLQKNHNNVK
jgi:hypothetical protein